MGANERIVAGSGNFVEIAAGTDESWGWTNPHPGDWIVEACYFHPMAALTAHASNNTALSVENGGTEIATITSVGNKRPSGCKKEHVQLSFVPSISV